MTTNVELQGKVESILEQIRPYLQNDGGDIRFVNMTDDNVVNVELMGACGSCPYSTQTLKNGVEQAVRKALPEIKSVEAINLNND
ncbi:MAG: NifU family protein [Bacteroidetes bacterium]|nr:MAG: NifU family protein [Bacteroidota bacterium]